MRAEGGGSAGNASWGSALDCQPAKFSSGRRTASSAVTSPATEITALFGTHQRAWNPARSEGSIDWMDCGVPPAGWPQGCCSP